MSILASTLLSTHKTKSKHDASLPRRGRVTTVAARPIHSVRHGGAGHGACACESSFKTDTHGTLATVPAAVSWMQGHSQYC